MVQFYPLVAGVDCYISRQIVLRPRIGCKSAEQVVLYRQQDFDLVAIEFLEWFPAVGQ